LPVNIAIGAGVGVTFFSSFFSGFGEAWTVG